MCPKIHLRPLAVDALSRLRRAIRSVEAIRSRERGRPHRRRHTATSRQRRQTSRRPARGGRYPAPLAGDQTPTADIPLTVQARVAMSRQAPANEPFRRDGSGLVTSC